MHPFKNEIKRPPVFRRCFRWILPAVAVLCLFPADRADALEEFQWPEYDPTVAYDYVDEYGELDPPTKVLDDVTGVAGTYTDGWWCFRWGADKNPKVTEAGWIPMIERFNKDFAYISDVMRWPRDKRASEGYYSTCYLFGSGLSTDNADNEAKGGWMGSTFYEGEHWPNILASYVPVIAFDPQYADGFQTGAMVHEGIHAILANMPGCKNSAWFHEGGNTWLQGTMEAQRNGNFSGMGWLSMGSMIAPFMPIECYTGWLQDGSFGGPSAQGVGMNENGQQICTWRNVLGGVQYSECFPHALEVMLGPQSVAWVWRYCSESGRVLQDLAEVDDGLGEDQVRRLIMEYRARQAFCDFGQWSYAYMQLLERSWGVRVGPEWEPKWQDCDEWIATCYAQTKQVGNKLKPEDRTLPGWTGANQIPLKVDSSASRATVKFKPDDENMGCQLVYRDNDGQVHYSIPVKKGACSIPLDNVMNDVVIAVICNMDYIYEGEETRFKKYDYTLTLGSGIDEPADIYTKWYAYSPESFSIRAAAKNKGSIVPAGEVDVSSGASQTFTFVPNPGYEVDQVILNGFPIGPMESYTFDDVHGNHTIGVTFKR